MRSGCRDGQGLNRPTNKFRQKGAHIAKDMVLVVLPFLARASTIAWAHWRNIPKPMHGRVLTSRSCQPVVGVCYQVRQRVLNTESRDEVYLTQPPSSHRTRRYCMLSESTETCRQSSWVLSSSLLATILCILGRPLCLDTFCPWRREVGDLCSKWKSLDRKTTKLCVVIHNS
jgi:hypothetical protein